MQRVRHPEKLGDNVGEPDAHEVSFVVLFDGWPDDVERFHASVAAHTSADWELVLVDNPVDEDASQRFAGLERTVHVPLAQKIGWAGGRNLGLRLATGRIVVIADTSVELTGDVVTPLARALADERTGLVGRYGVVTTNGFDFEETEDGEVDGVEAYLMAARRAVVGDVGLFDPKFKWYRNADVDWSFRFRAAGYRTVVDASLPVVRHEHRLWEATADRDELSRKNFWRFRDHWGERTDLFVTR